MLKQTCYGINVGCSLSMPDGSCVSLLFLLVISRISFSHYQRTVLPIYGHLLSVTLFFFFLICNLICFSIIKDHPALAVCWMDVTANLNF